MKQIEAIFEVADEVDPTLVDPKELVDNWIERFAPLVLVSAEWMSKEEQG